MSRMSNAILGFIFTLMGLVMTGVGAWAASGYFGKTDAERAADCRDDAPLCEDADFQIAMGVGVLGLIFLLMGLRWIARFFSEGRQIKRIQEVGVEVEGRITEIKSRGRRNDQPVFKHVISFDGPNGPESFDTLDTRLGYEGDKVMVKYDPENPSSARLSQVWLRSGHARSAHRAKYAPIMGESEILGMKFENADLIPMKQPDAVQDRVARVQQLQEALGRGEITMEQYTAEVQRISAEAESASPNPLGPPPG